MSADLDQFYQLLASLETLPDQGRRLADCVGRAYWPRRGVYLFRESGEPRASDQSVQRIVRVGTHAIGTGRNSTLWSRLRAHRGGKDGGGNHRGSVFRLHVGAALFARDGGQLDTWGHGSTAARSDRDGEGEHERRVSAYLGAMSVLWVAVPDEPGPRSLRAMIERNTIALLSNRLQLEDTPSEEWLGRHSPKAAIRQSGLWNVNHVDEEHSPAFLKTLELMIQDMQH
jgi:hypothetical protein